MKTLNRETVSGVSFYTIRMTYEELVILRDCLHDILLKSKEIEEQNPDKLSWYKSTFLEISDCIQSEALKDKNLKTRIILKKEHLNAEIFYSLKLSYGELELIIYSVMNLERDINYKPFYRKFSFSKKCNVKLLNDYSHKLQSLWSVD
ncbi:hypothetical protein KKJ25_17515 [Xenorhabdus bovienii]|uniref:Uncharacterized protein n=2 Tax=Xenorhabdus bovienii TaxID=40576 RepID=A0A077PDP6_XENBV|nr:hypothetical protein [Xenorhabdus bovienii]MDE1496677.1 hypothetical protein [Xenorhabdus bovienii]MDE9474292.1 hypothetical protein [Xenorhabdus bovienii]CDH07871.1 hypothetical protein XBO1_610002 [Xenorhabdus bovienii str. oregonense]